MMSLCFWSSLSWHCREGCRVLSIKPCCHTTDDPSITHLCHAPKTASLFLNISMLSTSHILGSPGFSISCWKFWIHHHTGKPKYLLSPWWSKCFVTNALFFLTSCWQLFTLICFCLWVTRHVTSDTHISHAVCCVNLY